MKTLRLMPLFACIIAAVSTGLFTALWGTPYEPVVAGLSVYGILFALYTIKSSR